MFGLERTVQPTTEPVTIAQAHDHIRLDDSEADTYVERLIVTARERAEALTIPREALRRRQGQEYVVVERDGVWVEQEVSTGWRSNSAVEVLRGLQEGEVLELNS